MERESAPRIHFEGHARQWDIVESYEEICPISSLVKGRLESCAKEAWRNAVRCIGRAEWQSLRVIDAQQLVTHDEIFEALISHLSKATNDGKIQPVITIFKEWFPNELEIRIWNHQLLRYAGYKKDDGSFLGDPMNAYITKIAMSLGWSPPAEPSPFDLLPIIIQVGNKLRWYEFPRGEVLEVRIRHPEYQFIEQMNLCWYAVPAISDMVFATGSGLHPCAPFNGYYMGAEIGARNFADQNRYNLLPEIATRLGL
ncbi:MAG: nitric oxide synthase oxygenase, partial [Cyanobacteria bacterium P01_H01_bin.15]